MKNSLDAILSETDEGSYHGDFGQLYARKLNSKIAGYRKDLDEWSDIVVMGLDSSTPGRMAITYYRELNGSEFLARVENWHESYAWFQYYGKDSQFVGAPSPKDIAVAAYGRRLDPKISKSTIARILPCIVDGLPIPEDLEKSVFKRAKNRISLEYWEREKILGIFCGLYRGLHKEMNYKMALDLEIKRRDYLYGRMLAVAEWIEQISLFVAKEKRDTNAAKLMHRFSERPLSTWRHIELALSPYKSRLRGSRGGFLAKMESLLDEISSSFISADDFINDEPLSGEFLLGYHCQRRDLRMKAKVETGHDEDEIYQEGEN
jgi:CRISPR-associated protein Csd1